MSTHDILLRSLITLMEGGYLPIKKAEKTRDGLSIVSDDNRITVQDRTEYYNTTVSIHISRVKNGNMVRVTIRGTKPVINLETIVAIDSIETYLTKMITEGVIFPKGASNVQIKLSQPSLNNRLETEFIMRNLLVTQEMRAVRTVDGLKIRLS